MAQRATPLSPELDDMPLTMPQLLAQARELHRLGRLDEAERTCAAILFVRPDNVEALHVMGLIKLARGEPVDALRFMAAAMGAGAPTARMLFDQGLALNALSRHQDALESFDRAIQLQPTFVQAHSNRGAMLAALGRHEDAA